MAVERYHLALEDVDAVRGRGGDMALKSRDRVGSMLAMMLTGLFVACGSMQPAERVVPTVRAAASLNVAASTEAAPTAAAAPTQAAVTAGQPAPLPPPSSSPAASLSSLVPLPSATLLIDRPLLT